MEDKFCVTTFFIMVNSAKTHLVFNYQQFCLQETCDTEFNKYHTFIKIHIYTPPK